MSTRLILADDHILVREGCRSLLERGGMDVVGEASDGYEAVRLAQRLQPDVAVLDVSMPLLNGLDTARQVRHVSLRTKIILSRFTTSRSTSWRRFTSGFGDTC